MIREARDWLDKRGIALELSRFRNAGWTELSVHTPWGKLEITLQRYVGVDNPLAAWREWFAKNGLDAQPFPTQDEIAEAFAMESAYPRAMPDNDVGAGVGERMLTPEDLHELRLFDLAELPEAKC